MYYEVSKLSASPQVFKPGNIHCMTASFLNGFKISDIDQLILELIFRVV